MKRRYRLEGLDCADCAARIEEDLRRHPGLVGTRVSFATQSVVLEDEFEGDAERIIGQGHPEVGLVKGGSGAVAPRDRGIPRELAVIIVSSTLALIGIVLGRFDVPTGAVIAAYVLSYLPVGLPVLGTAARNIGRGRVMDENFLMGIATLGAFALGQYLEAVSVMLFYAVGEYFQDMAVNRSRKSISGLMDLRPDTATLKTPSGPKTVRPEEVSPGQVIIVRPGERFPLDGEVVEGESSADTSALTGEAVPKTLGGGDAVMSGWVNGSGLLSVRVSKPYAESAVARILGLVEDAAANKAPTEAFITRFARYYTPAVVLGAALIAIIPPLVLGGGFRDWAYKALVLLVVSCPCALVLSIPLTYFAGLGKAARKGVLIKGSNHLDTLTRVGAVAFDKTGTLTRGVFRVVRVTSTSPSLDADGLLALAAGAEAHSSHPIAKSLVDEARRRGLPVDDGLDAQAVKGYEERRGQGIVATVRGRRVAVGRASLMDAEGAMGREDADKAGIAGETTVHVSVDGVYAGSIGISDEVKAGAAQGVSALRELGIERIAMLTGDRMEAAKAVATAVGIDDCRAALLPEDKVTAVAELQAVADGAVVFVGDGINDAPVLMRSDIGVAMGGLGSDAAIEAADLVVMDDGVSRIADAIRVARGTRRIVVQNIALTLSVKGVFIIMGLFGVATVWEAVIGDVGVALLAILNGRRSG